MVNFADFKSFLCDSGFFRRIKNPFVIAALLCAFLIYSGIFSVREKDPFSSPFEKESIVLLKGKISSNPSISSSGKFYSCSFAAEEVSALLGKSFCTATALGNTKLFVPSEILEAQYPGRLYSISLSDSVFETGERVLCTVSYSEKLGGFFVEKAEYLGYEKNFGGKLNHLRALCRLEFKNLMYSWNGCGGLVLSLLSGSREYLEGGLADFFRDAGLSHVLALSGMHLSFFAGLSGGLTKRLFGRKFLALGKILGIVFFVFFAGLSPSLFRALLCSLLMLLCSVVFCMSADFFIVLCISFLIHCAVQPNDIFSSAFMLSYGALAGILLFSDFFNLILIPFIPEKISSSLSASLSAQTSTFPLSAFLFGEVMPIGILSSVVISPLVSFFLTLALFAIILSLLFPFLANFFGIILNLLYKCIVGIVKVFALVPPLDFSFLEKI